MLRNFLIILLTISLSSINAAVIDEDFIQWERAARENELRLSSLTNNVATLLSLVEREKAIYDQNIQLAKSKALSEEKLNDSRRDWEMSVFNLNHSRATIVEALIDKQILDLRRRFDDTSKDDLVKLADLSVNRWQAKLNQMQEEREVFRLKAENAEEDWDRLQRLNAKGAASARDLINGKFELAQATLRLKESETELVIVQGHISAAKQTLDEVKKQ